MPDAVSPVPSARLRGNCSSMVRSLRLSRVLAAFSLVTFLLFSSVSSRAQEISAAPPQAQASTSTSASRFTKDAPADPADLEVSWRQMPARFLHHEKDMWLFPMKLGEGKLWISTAIVADGTAGFIKGDPPLERKVRQTDIFSEYNTPPARTFEQDPSGEDSA